MHQYPSVYRCAVHTPLNRLFDYLPPKSAGQHSNTVLFPGQRLWVPFGRRRIVAILVEIDKTSAVPPNKMRHAEQLIDLEPLFDEDHFTLLKWISDYYHHPLGDTLFGFTPPLLRKGRDAKEIANNQGARGWRLSTKGKGLSDNIDNPGLKRAPKQAHLLQALQAKDTILRADLDHLGINLAVVRAMLDKGLIEEIKANATAQARHSTDRLVPIEPNPEQQKAIAAVKKTFNSYQCHLLHGITGSGKTEVYLQLIAHALATGVQSLVLVPEIGLTPQMLQRFEQRFGANIVAIHSNLTDIERLNAWLKVRNGSAKIIIGTRSALLTPMPNLGLIVVDEEHDGSYKQQDGLRYSARDIAIKRAQLANVPIVLGTATPSLESLANAQQGRFHLLELQARAGGAKLPSFHIADGADTHCSDGVSVEILQAIRRHLGAGSQVLVFINRRGYAPALVCRQCGWMATCQACDSRMTAHSTGHKLMCHHCDARRRWPTQCPDCKQPELQTLGSGTQRLEEVLQKHYDDFPIIRVDRDSTQRKGQLASRLAVAHEGKPCILLGTQMLAKGHHFPNLSMAAILDADSALYSADFRGPERMAQTITQVAGRAGRGTVPGQVFVQSQLPNHPMLQSIISLPYADFARQLIEDRRRLDLPPFSKCAMLYAEHRNLEQVLQQLALLRDVANQHCGGRQQHGVTVVGPLPAPMIRKANRFRAQLKMFCAQSNSLHRFLHALRSAMDETKAPHGMRLALDVDPIDTN